MQNRRTLNEQLKYHTMKTKINTFAQLLKIDHP